MLTHSLSLTPHTNNRPTCEPCEHANYHGLLESDLPDTYTARINALLDLVMEADAHVVCLQEVFFKQDVLDLIEVRVASMYR